jgi:hypothetical protein
MKTMVLFFAMILGVTVLNAQTRTTIKVADLPKSISQDINSNHVGWKAIEAFNVNTNNVMSYEVVIEKGTEKMNLYYDKDAKFVRGQDQKSNSRMAHNSATQHNSSHNKSTGKK